MCFKTVPLSQIKWFITDKGSRSRAVIFSLLLCKLSVSDQPERKVFFSLKVTSGFSFVFRGCLFTVFSLFTQVKFSQFLNEGLSISL